MSTSAGAFTQGTRQVSAAETQKVEHEKRAEELRARLIAQNRERAGDKSNLKQANISIASTLVAVPPKTPIEIKREQQLPPEDLLGPETLMAAAKAAAQATTITKPQQKARVPAAPSTTPSHPPRVHPPSMAPPPRPPILGRPTILGNTDIQAQQASTVHPQLPTNLNGAYYADLTIWLEITGYHEVKYRKTKIERHELEQQATRIAERLQKLQQDEAMNTISPARPQPAIPTAIATALPLPQPPRMRLNDTAAVIGTKHPRSPEPARPAKARRVGHSPDLSLRADSPLEPDRGRRPFDPSPIGLPLENRVTYPTPRHRSPVAAIDNADYRRVRDPSLERRQAFYGPRVDVRREHDLYHPPRHGHPVGYQDYGRLQYTRENDQGRHEAARFGDDRRGARPDWMRGEKRRPH